MSNKQASADITMLTSQNMPLLQSQLNPNATNSVDITIVDGSALVQASGVTGTRVDIVEPKSTQISLYVVRSGDSLSQIAKMFGVSVNTIVWANDIGRGSIHEGDELVILPITGISHTVTKGETIRSIATKFKADMDEIIDYNGFRSGDILAVGSTVLIPDGEIQATSSISSGKGVTSPLRNAGGPLYKGYYVRPVDGGVRTQGLHGNNGIDIGASIGTPIHASADGVVIIARSGGYNGGYGSYVVISHPNGTQTLYAHVSRVLVSQGQAVAKGDTIALLGSTGKSTGPHVHFEVRGAANPF
ncbi:MAG: peptidoglycan DD-metalloendopeptidase family protein [Candidatus Paceibacterota bacterium]